MFVTGGDEGACKAQRGRKTGYMTNNARRFTLQYAHRKPRTEKGKICQEQKETPISTSKKECDFKFIAKNGRGGAVTEDSDDDEDSSSYKEFNAILEEMEVEEEELHLLYNASVFVAYFPPGVKDHGPLATYEMEQFTSKFTFYYYFATSRNKTCQHLKNTKRYKAQSRIVELMKLGAVCYRMDFVFKGKTTKKNRKDAFKWQQYWKYVGQMKKRFMQDNKAAIEILNVGLRVKVGYTGKITHENFHKARRFAAQARSFFPLPTHLLPVTTLPSVKKYRL